MTLYTQCKVCLLDTQAKEFLSHLQSNLEISSNRMKVAQCIQHGEKLRFFLQECAQVTCVAIRLLDFRSSMTLRFFQSGSHREKDIQFLPGTPWCGGKRGEQFQTFPQVANRFQIRIAGGRFFPCMLPRGNRGLGETGYGVVMGHEFGLGLNGLWKLRGQDLGNLLVVLTPRAMEQSLIGHILNQGMLKQVRGLRGRSPLIHYFRLHQLHQSTPQRQLVQRSQ